MKNWKLVTALAASIVLVFCALPLQAQIPTVRTVSRINTQQFQTITIKGTAFGNQGYYIGDNPYIVFFDETASWGAGYYNGGVFSGSCGNQGGDLYFLIVDSWTDTGAPNGAEIVLGGFESPYYPWGTFGFPNLGDRYQICIWNASTGEGPYVKEGTIQ